MLSWALFGLVFTTIIGGDRGRPRTRHQSWTGDCWRMHRTVRKLAMLRQLCTILFFRSYLDCWRLLKVCERNSHVRADWRWACRSLLYQQVSWLHQVPSPLSFFTFHSDRQLTAIYTKTFVGIKKYQPFWIGCWGCHASLPKDYRRRCSETPSLLDINFDCELWNDPLALIILFLFCTTQISTISKIQVHSHSWDLKITFRMPSPGQTNHCRSWS